MVERTRRRGAYLPFDATTAYLNSIPVGKEQKSPGNHELEHRIRSINRWNAMALVLRAGKKDLELGGHIASFQSSATLYDVGFNHFWRAHNDEQEGDLIYFQGHISPGVYARAFLEGRLSEAQLDTFRQEVDGGGLSSYPHPWLMEDFWQFPTVSMGLGPLMAIYQARFLKYLESRGLAKTPGRKVWCFCGDGEMDEPESLGAIALAAREGLDNLVFVINYGAYVREHFFGKYPELREMVANMSDDEIWALNRGGHDPHKVYAAYHQASYNANGRPTVILAKTIKGYGMGS
uniref:Transketolase N-terminal domain-containing protein n=1 Tax=Hucho hucho TaxID=62062 RepID=A0A4W5L5N5_9TELE